MENNLEVSNWFKYNNYFKGNLNDLQIWNKGDIVFIEKKEIPLYDAKGNFYKNEKQYNYITKKTDIRVDIYSSYGKVIIQNDYDFYLVPICERLSIIDGRNELKNLLINYGINGFHTYKDFFKRVYHYTYQRPTYEVERPIEVCFCDVHKTNTKQFIEFNYIEYINNYKEALIKYPKYKDEIEYLKNINISIICDFYMITEKELSSKKFDRLKHSIKVLNKKINNSLKN